MITPAQKTFFDTFGYLALPGLLSDSIAWIQDEFERVWASRPDVQHDGSQRTSFPGSFADQTARLCTLLDEPRIDDLATTLLGDGWGYYGGDGNLYSGDTGWHCDAIPPDQGGIDAKRVVRHLKIAFYLDPVGRDTGALRVIPGSHRWQVDGYAAGRDALYDPAGKLGVDGREVPAIALELVPGDIICFDHLVWHAAYGGGKRRRMFTMNLFEACRDEAQRRAAEHIFAFYGREGCRGFHGETMTRTATPTRRRRLDAANAFVPAMAAVAEAHAKEQSKAR